MGKKRYMIHSEYPVSDYTYGPDPQVANWTTYPTYSYEQFARANPSYEEMSDEELAEAHDRLSYQLFNSIDTKHQRAVGKELDKVQAEARRRSTHSRKNPLGPNPYEGEPHPYRMPTNAGPYRPQMYPHGVPGRPATYAPVKKNPRSRRSRRNPSTDLWVAEKYRGAGAPTSKAEYMAIRSDVDCGKHPVVAYYIGYGTRDLKSRENSDPLAKWELDYRTGRGGGRHGFSR